MEKLTIWNGLGKIAKLHLAIQILFPIFLKTNHLFD
ncbi:hypothetical protein ELUCI_v1c02300 [Williamsoniiplasma lucivorax]|uniref:Uncharacterized protein n=1 Tax=Williamsoniiplasma lucivorax TaxID=209274 RepID=A0A2S5RF33_9MOLU|nr:hypothetical protein ELUCI_v1c02300 [Williamsoniiplasma lucivorax]